MDGNDGHRLKRGKVGPTFSSFIAIPAKIINIIQKNLSWLVLPDEICLIYSLSL